MKAITEWRITDHGVEHSQYFQGAGISHTTWEACYTGIGDSLSEALEDALEQLAMAGDFDAASLPDGWDKGMLQSTDDKITPRLVEYCECSDCMNEDGERECTHDCECFASSELHCFVTLFVGSLPRE